MPRPAPAVTASAIPDLVRTSARRWYLVVAAMLATLTISSPAQAWCVENRSQIEINVQWTAVKDRQFNRVIIEPNAGMCCPMADSQCQLIGRMQLYRAADAYNFREIIKPNKLKILMYGAKGLKTFKSVAPSTGYAGPWRFPVCKAASPYMEDSFNVSTGIDGHVVVFGKLDKTQCHFVWPAEKQPKASASRLRDVTWNRSVAVCNKATDSPISIQFAENVSRNANPQWVTSGGLAVPYNQCVYLPLAKARGGHPVILRGTVNGRVWRGSTRQYCFNSANGISPAGPNDGACAKNASRDGFFAVNLRDGVSLFTFQSQPLPKPAPQPRKPGIEDTLFVPAG